MKFAMNGALTIGTLDGANIEIREEVGQENFFHFGLTTSELVELTARGYDPRRYYEEDARLSAAIDSISGGRYSGGSDRFRPLVESLMGKDPFFVLADYRSYVEKQETVGEAYRDSACWTRKAILNTARMGKFSSDRSIRDYCRDIWKVEPTPIEPS